MHYDFLISDQGRVHVERFAALRQEVLLLGGSRSPRYLTGALTALEGVLPRTRRAKLSRQGHTAAGNRQQGGRPDLVAGELRAFLGFHGGQPRSPGDS